MNKYRQTVGIQGEQLARVFLEQQNYQILECNYRCRLGEIDIVARKDEYLIFCEVKTRKEASVIHPTANITSKKLKKLRQLGMVYIQQKDCYHLQPRFDVIAIQLPSNQPPIIEHFVNAF